MHDQDLARSLPSAALFDMDGVLVDSEPWHTEAYVRAFSEAGLKLTDEDYRQAVTLGHFTVREFYQSLNGDMALWHDVTKRKAIIVKELMAERLELMPGIVRLLKALNDAGIPTALVTSAGRRSLEIIMDKYDLRAHFESILTWEDVNAIKPDPQGYIVTAERLGVKPEDCVVFEDTPRGVLAAHRAGMKCIAIPTSTTHDGDFSHATLVVKSLEDVSLDTLRKLF